MEPYMQLISVFVALMTMIGLIARGIRKSEAEERKVKSISLKDLRTISKKVRQ